MIPSTELRKAQTPQPFEMLTASLGAAPLCIHTASASLELDVKGICRHAFTLDGSQPKNIERFVGAQFVASVDAGHEGLKTQPHVGSHALLVEGVGTATPSLIKTAVITAVIYDHDLVD